MPHGDGGRNVSSKSPRRPGAGRVRLISSIPVSDSVSAEQGGGVSLRYKVMLIYKYLILKRAEPIPERIQNLSKKIRHLLVSSKVKWARESTRSAKIDSVKK